MSGLTPEARLRLERYLARMRSALRGSRAGETTELEQNVREHVEVAFADAAGPGDADRLDTVLAQLGPPDQWLSEDEQPWWRRIAARVAHGPEDWRLGDLTFCAVAVGLWLPAGGRGPRRCVVLPPIWLVVLPVAGLLLIAPVGALASLGISDGSIHLVRGIPHTQPQTIERVRIETGYIAASAGAWWLLLSAILPLILRPLRAVFLPVTQNLGRKHAVVLALIGAMVGTIGAVLLFVI